MPPELPPLIPQGSGFPEQPADQRITDISVSNNLDNYKNLQQGFSNEFPVINVNGQSISDLVNEASNLQAQNQYLLDNYPDISTSNRNRTGFNMAQAVDNVFANLNSGQSFASKNTAISLGKGEDFERYANSDSYKALGYTPGLGLEQEYKYGRSMSWADTIGSAVGGGSQLAWNTFVEGWKGWGRMTDALFSLDASKLMGSEEERYQMAKEQEEIFNKYAIFDTETSKDSFFNRQFFGTMLQQSGFAIGAIGQFALESFLTGGIGGALEGALGSVALAKGVNVATKTEELVNNVRKASAVILNSEKTTSSFAQAAKNLIPAYGTIQELTKLKKAGAGIVQLGMAGLGATKRAMSEFNMARSESIFEAASTYKDLTDRLTNEYIDKNGTAPVGEDLEKIRQSAENASHDNFYVNLGVLSVMNRLQFDNMLKSFKGTRNIFSEQATHLAESAFKVTGEVGGKSLSKVYQKGWFFGELGAVKSIAKDFGKKQAAWEATKMLGKGLTKIEGSEGVQELIQNASNKGMTDYYYDLYHGKKGYTGKLDAVLSSMQNPLTDMEGAKTFLMGALTGALISPGAKIISKGNESIAERRAKKNNPNYQSKKEQAAESIALVNSMYQDPTQFKKEWIAAVKVNNKAADTMEEAAKNHNKYVFYNAKESAFAKTVSAAIKLDMFSSMRDTIKELGSNMSDEEFKKAFDIDASDKNKGDVKSFMGEIAKGVEDYYETFTTLKDKFGDKVLPELYKNNTPEEYFNAKISQAALNDAIEILSTNTYRAKQTIKRAGSLQTEIASNKNIGASSIEVLTKLGSEKAIADHIKVLEDEIKVSTMEGVKLTREQKEIIKDKKKELELAKKWQSSHAEIVDNTDESYSPAAEKRAYESYADLINLYNTRAKNTSTVSKSDVDDNFINIIDYIRLNKDNKSYVDAINLLSDPYNMKLVTDSMVTAHRMVNESFKVEHKEEVKKATGTEDEISADDIQEKVKKSKEKAAREKTTFEKYLLDEYNKEKKKAEDDKKTIPDFEKWRKFAEPGLRKKYDEELKKVADAEADDEPDPSGDTKDDFALVNGKLSKILTTTQEGELVRLEYQEVSKDGKGAFGSFVINTKTKEIKDEKGNPVKLEAAPVSEEPAPIQPPINTKLEGTNERGTTYKGETTEKDGLKITKYSEFFPDGRRVSKGGRIMTPSEFIKEYNITDEVDLDQLEGATEIRIFETRTGQDGKQNIDIEGSYPEGKIETSVKGLENPSTSVSNNIEAKKADIETAFDYITTRKYKGENDRLPEINKVGEDLAKRFVATLKEKGLVKEDYRMAPRTDGSVEKMKVNTDAEGNNLGNDWSTAGKFKDEFRKFVDAELATLENKPTVVETLTKEKVLEILQEEEKRAVQIDTSQSQEEIIANIKKELDLAGLPYQDVVSPKFSTYNVITKNGKEVEILKFLKMGEAPVPAFILKGKLINALTNEEKIQFAKDKLAALEGSNNTILEPELEAGDYRKAYALGRAVARGNNINNADNFNLISNYGNLIEAAATIETNRIEELSKSPKSKVDVINQKYDQQAKDLMATGTPVPTDIEEDNTDYVPDTAQILDRKKLADMKASSEFGNAEYQVGWRQLYPSNSLANRTDNFDVNINGSNVTYTRTDVNKDYVFDVATPEVQPGKAITYEVMTADEYYDSLPANRLTGQEYTKAALFNTNGTVKEDKYDEVPIGVYAEIRGKKTLIGTIHDPLWIQYEINGRRPHISTPEGMNEIKHMENEVKNNRDLRKVILDSFNKNSSFVITGHISGKSIGVLKLGEDAALIKERVNPKIAEGGETNRHGFFAIVRNGRLETSINKQAANVQENNAYTENMDKLSGMPALMLPTPTGTFMPTYIGLPKVDKGQAEFIIEAWKAFTGKTENDELVAAVYKSLNREMSDGLPDIGVLRDYISQYITNLENTKKLDRVGTGAEAPKGGARLNIYNDGNIGLEVKDEKTGEWYNNGGKPIRTEADLPANIIDLLQNLATSIKFENRRNSDLIGINSTTKINFLSMQDGKLVSKEMTYNEYIMNKATTFVEKGTISESTNKDWVYFANPVVKMEYSKGAEEDSIVEEEENKASMVSVFDLFADEEEGEEDLFDTMERALAVNNLTDEQVEEESKRCNPFEDA